jgi:O-antigen ligase
MTASISATLSVTYPELFGVALALYIVTLAAFRVDALLYLIVFCLPFAPLLNTHLAIRDVSSLLRYALFAGLALSCIFGKTSVREWLPASSLNAIIFIYGLTALLSVLAFNEVNPSSQRALFRLFAYFALFFTIVGWVKTREQIWKLMMVLMYSTILVALFGIYQALINDYGDIYYRLYPLQEEGVQPWEGRVSSFLFHFNSLAGYLNLVLPFCLASVVISKRRGFRRLATICFVLGSLTLVLTQSRGGLIAYAGTFLLAILFLTKSRKLRFRLLAFFPVGALTAVFVMGAYAERLSAVDEFTSTSRLMVFGAAVNLFLSKPIIGVGYGNFRELYATIIPISGGVIDSHNLYLQLLSETGILGFVTFMALISGMVRLALRQLRDSIVPVDQIVGFGALAAIFSVLTHGFVDFLFHTSPQFGALFWLVLGLLVAKERLRTSPAQALPAWRRTRINNSGLSL